MDSIYTEPGQFGELIELFETVYQNTVSDDAQWICVDGVVYEKGDVQVTPVVE